MVEQILISKYRKPLGPVPANIGLWRRTHRLGFSLLPGRIQNRLLYRYDFLDLLTYIQQNYRNYYVTIAVPLLPKYPCTYTERLLAMFVALFKSRIVCYRLDIAKAHQLSIFLNPFFVGGSNDMLHVNWIRSHAPDCVQYIDVGANVGTMTIPIAKLCPSLNVVSLEPVPSNFAMLSYNVSLNKLSNVNLVQAAVTTTSGTVQFNLNVFQDGGEGINHTGHGTCDFFISDDQLAKDYPGFSPTMEVNAVRLDELVDGRPSIVKIDTEGHDAEVLLSGIVSLRKKAIRHLIVEISDETAERVYSIVKEYFSNISNNPVGRRIEPVPGHLRLGHADLLCSL